MAVLSFQQLDVFADEPFKGNALAVVLGADDLADATMATIATWTNLSETTFLLNPTAPSADYRVRIFTPERELPFAGHPTLGSCRAWLNAGHAPKQQDLIVQECGAGLVPIKRDGHRLAFAAPPLQRTGDVDAAMLATIARGLGIEANAIRASQWVDNGPGWVMLATRAEILALRPDYPALGEIKLGVVAPWDAAADGTDAAFEVRAFIPSLASEDPVTGSFNAGLAQWLISAQLAPRQYIVSQGTALGRRGRVHIASIADEVWVGGETITCIEGQIRV